ncbi:MAG: flavodoxin family protein [Promethearchaeota archaeon]|jgi:flavodoxin
MNVLIVYFSLGGRTKQVAKRIAEGINFSDVNIENFEYIKKSREIIPEQDEIMKVNLSNFKYNEEINDLSHYDLVFFGFPTHGGLPATVFNGYLKHAQNFSGKEFVIFNSCRLIPGKTLEIMQTEIEQKGGFVVNKRVFRGLFKIKMSKVDNFINELNQNLVKSS